MRRLQILKKNVYIKCAKYKIYNYIELGLHESKTIQYFCNYCLALENS